MDWIEKCGSCAKHGHLINQGIEFCLEEECNYEPIQWQDYETYSTSGIVAFDDQGELIDYSVVEGQMVIDYPVEVEQYEQTTLEIDME